MGVAVATPQRADRPGRLERILVLGICSALLVVVNAADERGRERNEARAEKVMAERAAERSSREAMTAPAAGAEPARARRGRLGEEEPIVIPAGSALGPATSVVQRRAVGPEPSSSSTTIPEPQTAPATPAASASVPAGAAAASAGSGGDEPLLLALMAALGLSMAGGGLRLVSRRSA